jgi:hypothetical protein
MKPMPLILAASVLAVTGTIAVSRLFAAEPSAAARSEYVTIRWGGREHTHIIRPGGQVEFVGFELRKVVRPDRADDRAFYMNVVMNGLARDGYEVVCMTPDDIVMRRTAR